MRIWFLGCEVAEILDFSVFWRYGVRYVVWDEKIGILLDFVGILEDIDKVKFWRRSVDESAIGSAAFLGYIFSFCHPPYTINPRYFYKLPWDRTENYVMWFWKLCIINYNTTICYVYIVIYSFIIITTIYNKIIKTCWQSYEHMIKYRQVKNEPQKNLLEKSSWQSQVLVIR